MLAPTPLRAARLPTLLLSITRSAPRGAVFMRGYSSSAPRQRNRVYNAIRSEDEFATLNLMSASTRIPLITLWTASWCPSCKLVSPLLKELVEAGVGEAQGGVSFAEVEVDSPTLGDLGGRYQITSIPTLLSFDRQEAQTETRVTRLEDLKNRQFLTDWLEREAKRHGEGGGGGSGVGLFGGFFGGGTKQ